MHPALRITPNAPDTQGLEGWYSRSLPLAPEMAATFTPALDDYKLAVRINAMGGDTILLALFRPNIAMDNKGSLLALFSSDFEGIVSLAEKVDEASDKENGQRVRWRIDTGTCKPFHILQLPNPTAENPYSTVETSVYGYSKGLKELSPPVGDVTELPDIIYEFFALAKEAETDYTRRGENKVVFDAVKRFVERR